MTVEIPPSVGDPTKLSERFTARVNGAAVEVIGLTATTRQVCRAWSAEVGLHASHVVFGRDEEVTLHVLLKADETGHGDITSATVYPAEIRDQVNATIVADPLGLEDVDVLQLTIPADGEHPFPDLYVEINGITRMLVVCPRELSPALPDGAINLAELDPRELQVGEVGYWPPGVHSIGLHGCIVKSECTVIHQPGSYVIGTYEMRPDVIVTTEIRDVMFRGWGHFSGEFQDPNLLTTEQLEEYAMWHAQDGVTHYTTNSEIREIIVIRPCGYVPGYAAANTLRRLTIINPWQWGIVSYIVTVDPENSGLTLIEDCFSFYTDDVFPLGSIQNKSDIVQRCYTVTANGSSLICGYFAIPDGGEQQLAESNGIYSLAEPATELAVGGGGNPDFDAAVKAWSDTSFANSAYGLRNVTIRGFRVDGPNSGCAIGLRNKPYPFGVVAAQDGAGQIESWLIEGLQTEFAPSAAFKNYLLGLDEQNGIRDIVFKDCYFGGVLLTDANFLDYFDVNAFASWSIENTEPEEPDPDDGEFTPLLVATAKSVVANSYLTVAEANTTLRRRLYTTAWDAASSTPNAEGYAVSTAASAGATEVEIAGGTGLFTANTVVTFSNHDTEYTVTAALGAAGTLQFTPALTTGLTVGAAVNRQTANEREKALMWATQVLDAMMAWFGYKTTSAQALWFPASGIPDENGTHYDYETIPTILKVATAELALYLLANPGVFDPPPTLGLGISEGQIGPMKVKIDDTQQLSVIPENILSYLSTLGVLEPEASKGSAIFTLRRV